jgi:two-component system, OmpR family, phosphate regulon response regulator PhoB
MGPPRGLVVEDDRDSARLVSFHLERAGFEVQRAETGAEAIARARAWHPQVVMLDVRLPDIDGFAVCAALRAAGAALHAPGVLMLTAQGLDEDRVKALELGADDYLVKPFLVRELILRVTALARRVGAPVAADAATPAPILRCGAIELDPRTLAVRVAGAVVELRPAELRLLQLFLHQPGVHFSRKELLDRVWCGELSAGSRAVDITVHRLRRALGAHGAMLETIHEAGYALRAPGPRQPATR